MDLSSLEGPPTMDTRFSSRSTSAANSVPHIRVAHVQSPLLGPVRLLDSSRWDLPPRPASTSVIPPRSKYPNTGPNGFWQSIHPDNSNNNNITSFPDQDQSFRHEVSQEASQPINTLSLPSPRSSSRAYSNSGSTPHRLVWVESEQIWILTTTRTAPTPTPYQQSQSSLSPMLNARPTGRTRSLSHLRSTELVPSTDHSGGLEPDDLPPPYEQHIFDQPLAPILPTVTRVSPEELTHSRESRWTAIGRRVS